MARHRMENVERQNIIPTFSKGGKVRKFGDGSEDKSVKRRMFTKTSDIAKEGSVYEAKQREVPSKASFEDEFPEAKIKAKPTFTNAEAQKFDKGEPIVKEYARGGPVKESKAMVKEEVAFFKKKGASPSMIAHEERELKGMYGGGVARGTGAATKGKRFGGVY